VVSPPAAGAAEGLLLGEGHGEGRDTPRPEAAERPAPQRAMTRFALARVSRNDCISWGVIVCARFRGSTSRLCGPSLRRAAIAVSKRCMYRYVAHGLCLRKSNSSLGILGFQVFIYSIPFNFNREF
jgi:hypothetical protein